MQKWSIVRLDASHDRSSFDCGNQMLNEWLASHAGQYERRDLSRVYVAIRPGESTIRGYYAISMHRVVFDDMPAAESKGLPRIDIPVLLIGRLAVDTSIQRQGLGSLLLVDVLRRALRISEQVGIRAVEVDAIDETAQAFYLRFGFHSLLDDPKHLFMPLREIRKLKLDPLP